MYFSKHAMCFEVHTYVRRQRAQHTKTIRGGVQGLHFCYVRPRVTTISHEIIIVCREREIVSSRTLRKIEGRPLLPQPSLGTTQCTPTYDTSNRIPCGLGRRGAVSVSLHPPPPLLDFFFLSCVFFYVFLFFGSSDCCRAGQGTRRGHDAVG